MKDFPYKRILIVGCGGAGKSTLARAMGEKFKLPVVHLDKLWWLPNWVTRSESEFDDMLSKELKKESWIIEGNFLRTLGMRLERADLCIFLDYDTEVCLSSVHDRVRKYEGKTRPDMTDGCTETADPVFEEWINSFGEKVRPLMLEQLNASNVPHKIFMTRDETEKWLSEFFV